MSLDTHSGYGAPAVEAPPEYIAGHYPDWSERIVTIVAVSLAVLVVALIAVVMGMA
jgi:hypothetical protein